VANFGSECAGRISGDDLPHPPQHLHRCQDQTTSGQTDEGERSKSQNDERNFARNQGMILLKNIL